MKTLQSYLQKGIQENVKESILDDEETVEKRIRRQLVTIDYLKGVFKKCIPNIETYNITILETGMLQLIDITYRAVQDGINLIADLPDDVAFESFLNVRRADVTVSAVGDKVTTLAGLPADLSDFELRLNMTPNLKDCGDVQVCKTLIIKQTKDQKIDLKKFKRLPKALKYIRLIGFDDITESFISKISGTPKNKITIL